MKKYDPDESITCPKCGKAYKAEVMGPKYCPKMGTEPTFMVLTSLCGFELERLPLDYEEPT